MFFMHSDSTLNSDDAVCSDSESYDYEDIENQKIVWRDLFNAEPSHYYVYAYSPYCGHCLEIRDGVIHYSRCGSIPLFFVEASDEIAFGSHIETTIGAVSIEQLWILGYPSLLEIKNGTLIANTAGSSKITEILQLAS